MFPQTYRSVGILNILILLIYTDSLSILMLMTKTWAFFKATENVYGKTKQYAVLITKNDVVRFDPGYKVPSIDTES